MTINAVNDPPSFTKGGNQAVNEDAGAITVSNWAQNISAGPGESGQAVIFSFTNDNNSLFSEQPAVDSDSGDLTYTPAPDAVGSATVTVALLDSAGATSGPETFTITVNAVNDKPDFTADNPPAIDEDAGAQTVPGWVSSFDPGGGDDESGQTAQAYTVSNISNAGLFATEPSVSLSGDLSYTPADDANGTSNFDVVVQDDGGTANSGEDTSSAQTFTITVNAVNDSPSGNVIITGSTLEGQVLTADTDGIADVDGLGDLQLPVAA